MSLEDNLRRALRRTPAPPDLADRVLANLQHREVLRAAIIPRPTPPRLPVVRWVATAAAVALVAIGGERYYTYQQTVAEAERVQKEVRLALQIAGEKLALVQRKLRESQR
jgi:hypothetical protein